MNFEPAPANDFYQFMSTYYDRCRQRVPQICVVAAKWTPGDLIPGLSDFDTRFIVADDMTPDGWGAMSRAVGEVHSEMARQFPHWSRNLEHLPGLNLAVSEMTDPVLFYPEFAQWTLYEGEEQAKTKIEAYMASRTWSARDELYHLKKIATFIGPYMRGIDPPVNLGPWENKYPLHSRFMHYFTPPVQAGVSLALKRNVKGKFEALRLASEMFPNANVIEMILDVVVCHYERSDDYIEPRLTEIERALETYLQEMWGALAEHVTLVDADPADGRDAIRAKVAAVPLDATETFFGGVKFCRLMEGRLRFYAEDIPSFDSTWLIHNELDRIVANFHDVPLSVYGQARFGEQLAPAEVLDRLRGEILTADQCDRMSAFAELAGRSIPEAGERLRAREIAEIYPIVLLVVETLGAELQSRLAGGASA